MICNRCGQINSNGSSFCVNCGVPLTESTTVNSQTPVAGANKLQGSSRAPAGGQIAGADVRPGNSQEPANYRLTTDTRNTTLGPDLIKPTSGKFSYIVDPDERIIYMLSNDQAMNLMSSEGFVDEAAVITNKRLYYNKSVGLINKRNVETTVDLEDITATTLTSRNMYGYLIMAALMFLGGLIPYIAAGNNIGSIAGLGFGIVMSILCIVSFFLTRIRYFRIHYASSTISFSLKKYSMATIRTFQRQIYYSKELLKKGK